MSRVSRAMTSSSLVGMTHSWTRLESVEMRLSLPRLALAASSISQPR